MLRLFALLRRLESSLANVLVLGASGTGKELVARAVHEHSSVRGGPFVAVNCAALDRALVRSELFGHVRGAFTGALETRVGAFEAASGGTLFLDEVGDLPPEVQPVLLRVLEQAVVTRLGEHVQRPVDVRLMAATNRRLEELVAEGRFREDLYYRLAVVEVELPVLSERAEDIPLLVKHIAAELGAGPIPDEVAAELQSRDWPGNVRELKNALSAWLAVGALPKPQQKQRTSGLEEALRQSIDVTRPFAEQKGRLLTTFQRLYLERVLEHSRGNQSEASRISGIERSYLNTLVRRYALRAPRAQHARRTDRTDEEVRRPMKRA